MEWPETVCNTFNKFSSTVVNCCKHIWEEHRTALIVTTAVFTAVKVHHVVKRRKLREKWDSAGENVVVVHTIPNSTACPNMSPFVMKLETYLRMAGIQYKHDLHQPYGPKGKFPWITLNGEDYTDSQLIMELLGKKFKKDFDSNLNEEQKAIARAMLIMNDEHIFWGLVWWRFVKDPDYKVCDFMKLSCPARMYFKYLRCRTIPKQLWAQGIGRHTDYDLVDMIRKDLEALSLYLGQKNFLMGDTPCEVDCAVFGTLCQFVWGSPGSAFTVMLQNDYQNLQTYCIRMKEKFWPDWDQALLIP